MHKLVYDYQAFMQRYGGVSRYIYELATHISSKSDVFDVKILALAHVNEYLKNCSSLNLVVGLSVPALPKGMKIISNLNAEVSKLWLNSQPPDIVHETNYLFQKLAPKNTRVVTTVHDMIHEKFGQLFSIKDRYSERKNVSVKRADHIICVSESTKKDLIEIWNVPPKKVTVVYHGYSFNFGKSVQGNIPKISHPYILYVGFREGYKNSQNLLQAYASSKLLRNNFRLVFFGGKQFSHEELDSINALGLPADKVLQVSGDDSVLVSFYRNASVFVYPSLYEGFGMPILEAMSFNCPVACSNTSSIPEVAGNAAEFFDPYQPESIAAALEKIVMFRERREELVSLGLERVKQFSWEVCAEKTKSVYLSML